MVRQAVTQICFDFVSRLPIVVEPRVVRVSSDTGILPIRQFDDQIGSTDRFIAGCIPFRVANLGCWSPHAARWIGRETQKASHDRLIRWPIRAVIAKAPPSLHSRPLPLRR